MSLKRSLLPICHWPADRLLALPGPFHVIKFMILFVLSTGFLYYYYLLQNENHAALTDVVQVLFKKVVSPTLRLEARLRRND